MSHVHLHTNYQHLSTHHTINPISTGLVCTCDLLFVSLLLACVVVCVILHNVQNIYTMVPVELCWLFHNADVFYSLIQGTYCWRLWHCFLFIEAFTLFCPATVHTAALIYNLWHVSLVGLCSSTNTAVSGSLSSVDKV